jgi:nicotinamide-nucleotide amidase
VFGHSVVGDNLERIVRTLRAAARRADVVVVTGGLGPTPDDLTREAIAAFLGRPLRRDAELEQRVKAVFERLGRPMPAANLRQADLPKGATAIPPVGTAPGFYVHSDSALLVALPGVPWEMEAMLSGTVVPLLRGAAGAGAIVSREILVVGLGESATHEIISDLVERQGNPTLAYLAGGGRVRVRVTAKAVSADAARALVDPVVREVRARLGDAAVPGEGTLAQILGRLLVARGATVGVAESLTGGLIGAELSAEPGSSRFFSGSLVCYSTSAKSEVAGVDPGVLERAGAVSEQAARALAEGAAKAFGADVGLSATGVAGPGEHEGKPAGTIFAAATLDGRTVAQAIRGYGDRSNVRAMAVTTALDLGRRILDGR